MASMCFTVEVDHLEEDVDRDKLAREMTEYLQNQFLYFAVALVEVDNG